jgi:4-hydroxyproline epimerase
MKKISIIDSHTGGEPTRCVVSGFPDLGNGNMSERLEILSKNHDAWRTAVILEPRGSDVIVGALLQQPVDVNAATGVIYFNNTGYLGMCGHGTIGLVTTLAYMGRIKPGVHKIETPVGNIEATLHDDGSVSVRNVPAWRYAKKVPVNVPEHGLVYGDIAYGGNWFFLISDHGQRVEKNNKEKLLSYTSAVMDALVKQGITGANGALIDHIELFGDDDKGADSRNFVLCPGKAYDRSPCGTGTSAKLSCLASDKKLQPGAIWRQASIIGSLFEGSYETSENEKIIPTIRGRAHISAEATLIIQSDDPFAWGIV